jgi:hypothetical protein
MLFLFDTRQQGCATWTAGPGQRLPMTFSGGLIRLMLTHHLPWARAHKVSLWASGGTKTFSLKISINIAFDH